MPTFFESACLEGQLEDVKFFLTRGHPVNKPFGDGFSGDGSSGDRSFGAGLTPLMLAASMGHLSLCLLLLRHGADVDLKNNNKQTAAMLAQQGGYLMLARLLCGKSEQRQRHRSSVALPSRQTESVRLARLLSYGIKRGFLSDAQIYGYLPGLRNKPKRFALICQALKDTGIVLRDREPTLAVATAAPMRTRLNPGADLEVYADQLLTQIDSPLASAIGFLSPPLTHQAHQTNPTNQTAIRRF